MNYVLPQDHTYSVSGAPLQVTAVNPRLPELGTICFAVASSLPCQELDHARPAALPTRWETITPMLSLATVASADNCAPLVITMMALQLEQYWLRSGSEHHYSPVPAHRDPEVITYNTVSRFLHPTGGREPKLPFHRGSPAAGFFRPAAGITKRAHLTRIANASASGACSVWTLRPVMR